MSATQGAYSTAQFLLDVTQGARIASSALSARSPPAAARSGARRPGARRRRLAGGAQARRTAPQLLRPGLLRQPARRRRRATPGIARRRTTSTASLAADRSGHDRALSRSAPPRTLLARIAALQRHERLVVADLPGGAEGVADLRALSARDAPRGELLIVVQRVPDAAGDELLWSGAPAGCRAAAGSELSSAEHRTSAG